MSEEGLDLSLVGPLKVFVHKSQIAEEFKFEKAPDGSVAFRSPYETIVAKSVLRVKLLAIRAEKEGLPAILGSIKEDYLG